MPRIYCPSDLASASTLDLPAGAARHVQVLRLQPGDAVTLFSGQGGEVEATITRMGRSSVEVCLGAHHAIERENPHAVHLAVGMPANERMDWLVEKATELGVASIQPLLTERTVLRLSGERAEKKVAHWHSVAVAACEQCGGNRIPQVWPVQSLVAWLHALPTKRPHDARWLLSLAEGALALQQHTAHGVPAHTLFLSGPEGGFSAAEEAAAAQCGFAPVTLGPRVLRAETAALAALARLADR